MRFIFASVFHEYPTSARALVRQVLRCYPESEYVYVRDVKRTPLKGVWDEVIRLRYERSRYCVRYPFRALMPRAGMGVCRLHGVRQYSWKNLQRYLFDVIDYCGGRDDYDYLILLDSDAWLVAPRLESMLEQEGRPDFSVTADDLSNYKAWTHGQSFSEQWEQYARIARDLGLRPKLHGLGTMFGMVLLKSNAVKQLADYIPRLEAHPLYRAFEQDSSRFPFYEAFIPQFLGDLGLRHFNVRKYCNGYRVRPFWTSEEYDPEVWFYHPVHRHPADPFRRKVSTSPRAQRP